MTHRFPVIILQEQDGMYTASVPTLRGCHTQAKTLPTLYRRMQEVIALCEEIPNKKLAQSIREARRGISVQRFENKEDFFASLKRLKPTER